MLNQFNPDEKETLKNIDQHCQSNHGYYFHDFEQNIEGEKYNQQKELKAFSTVVIS